ncbi:prephenate dehydrogenase [Methanobrevibacter curvatus]|uniref:T-protein n=1 Tax=Methanobrevibacter curvatus TaxID=49547 RepID=A0A165ZJI3_9EURY|nr:prephenate dehydrogenase [Methanobrevibacter curvatus]KZX10809.1 T-protein [Methanobrevibacter curvatus]
MKIAVLGGTDGLGKTIAKFLKKEGFELLITGQNTSKGEKAAKELGLQFSNDNKLTASKSDIIIIAVPIDKIENVIQEIANFLKPNSLVIDVGSIKEKPAKAMVKYLPKNHEFIPIHPIFGPRTTSLKGQVMVLTPLKKGKWYFKIINYLKNHQVKVIETSPEEHDKMMGIVQVLTHFSYISTAYALKKLKVDIKKTREFASPIYNLMVDIIGRIVSQNPELTYSIQKDNLKGKIIRECFLNASKEINESLNSDNKEKFKEIAISATKNINDIESSLGRSDKAIDSITNELIKLTESLKKEIAVKHIYSKEIHYGFLEKIDSDFIFIKNPNSKAKKCQRLKISNIELLSSEDFLKWKKNNIPTKNYQITVVFNKNSDPEVIKNTLEIVPNVINVKIVEIYKGNQINENQISINFSITTFKKKDLYKVTKILKGFGGIIR